MDMFFKEGEFAKSRDIKKQVSRSEQDAEEDKLYCAYCGQHITRSAFTLSVSGAATHTFSNPAGFVYYIQCFSDAPGCRVAGKPTAEHSWFTGYQWQLALCQSCQNHLGWYFINGEPFYGLIRGRLTGTG